MATTKKKTEETVDIQPVERGMLGFRILGTTPLILNRMSRKAMQTILFPAGRKTEVQKKTTLKHDPMAEFLASAYTDKNPESPTLLQHLASAFKGAMKGAAIDLQGATKAEIGRLTWVDGERVSIYGIPQMFMSVTRSADINKTPDVRTRMIVPRWACEITVAYVMPNLRPQGVVSLVTSAGMMQGVGDWRTGKGSGTYGMFSVVNEDDPQWHSIVKNGGRDAQIEALKNPDFYDDETAEMYTWFQGEVQKRGFETSSQSVEDLLFDDDGESDGDGGNGVHDRT